VFVIQRPVTSRTGGRPSRARSISQIVHASSAALETYFETPAITATFQIVDARSRGIASTEVMLAANDWR
jgi:hypothetical protein